MVQSRANNTVRAAIALQRVEVAAYAIPTDQPESDGTFPWDSTTLVTVHVAAGDARGFGYTYAPAATGRLIVELLAAAVEGRDAMAVEQCWQAMFRAVRNAGRPGIAAAAISAVDVALWDLKAKLFGVPLIELWGRVRAAAPVYGSGGFTSYGEAKLAEQLGGWAADGIGRVKMKVGRDPPADLQRVRAARQAIGPNVELFVDANGAYSRKQAMAFARQFADEAAVGWFEEPVSSDDLAGLRLLRDRGPAGQDVAAGEYGYTTTYFRRMLAAQAVDCLQADATRCGGFTGFFKVAALCEAFSIPLSAHCAPHLHASLGCCVEPLRHIEYFHDHVRIAELLFDGTRRQADGFLQPDAERPGHGLSVKTQDAQAFAVPF